MKCSCAAERSFNSDARHFVMNASGVIVPDGPSHPVPHAVCLVQLNGPRAFAPIPCCPTVSCKMQSRSDDCKGRGVTVDHGQCAVVVADIELLGPRAALRLE